MDRSRFEVSPGIWLDARRAAWLPEEGVLAVGDLHLGYAWVQRQRGQLFPIDGPDPVLERLLELIDDYQPRELVILGDVIHGPVPVPAVEEEVVAFVRTLEGRTRLRMVPGNHDTQLEAVGRRAGITMELPRQIAIGPHSFLHGHDVDEAEVEDLLFQARFRGGWVLMGHEHPALNLGDGVATQARCPCFLAGDGLLVLPAFSLWAGGVVVSREPFLSALTRSIRLERVVAIVGPRLLPLPPSAVGLG